MIPDAYGSVGTAVAHESGSERIPRSLLRGKGANGEHYYSLRIGDSPQLTAESFNFIVCLSLVRKLIEAMTVFPARGLFTGHTQADAIIINLVKISSDKNKLTKFVGYRKDK
jgi:hypothetical protein